MRRARGQFYTLFRELREHPVKFKNYVRMSIASFDKLLNLLRPR